MGASNDVIEVCQIEWLNADRCLFVFSEYAINRFSSSVHAAARQHNVEAVWLPRKTDGGLQAHSSVGSCHHRYSHCVVDSFAVSRLFRGKLGPT